MENKENKNKPSYEQLEFYLNQLSEQNIELRKKLKELSDIALYKRIDYLFKVIELKDNFSLETISSASKEITNALFFNEEDENIKENNAKKD